MLNDLAPLPDSLQFKRRFHLKRLVAIVYLGTALSAAAQSTWQGLQFGQDRAEAAQVMAAKQYNLNPGDAPRTATITPDFIIETSSSTLSANLRAQIAKAPMYFIPVLSFDASEKLNAVTLKLDEAKSFQATPALGGQKALLTFIAGTSLFEQLTNKYGKSISATGPCAEIDLASLVGATTECNARWSSNNQIVELHWDYRGRVQTLNLVVLYKPVPSSV